MKYSKSYIDMCKKLGKKIQTMREDKQITIDEFAKITRLRKEYIKKIENGEAYGLTINKHLLKIRLALKVKFTDLFNF